ncbi:MAG: hypothetical protein R2991_11050 [Thermoanaerobaculia bacterium]
MQRLVPDRLCRRWSDRALASKRYSCSTFMLYLGIDGPLPQIPHHTIHLASDYREHLNDIERDHRLSENPSSTCRTPAPPIPPWRRREPARSTSSCRSATSTWASTGHGRHAFYRDLILRRLAKIGLEGLGEVASAGSAS